MNRLFLVLVLIPLFLVGCKTKEEKAAELIKNELSKTLYDFESYSPIETVVSEAKMSAYTDTTTWALAEITRLEFNKLVECMEKLKDAEEHMDIWGPPTYYSSTYSDNQYYKYKKEYDSQKDKFLAHSVLFNSLVKTLKENIDSLNTDVVVGWEVNHRFRCKTRGGSSTIGDYRYVIDKDFKNVLIVEDNDDEGKNCTSSLIKSVLNGDFDDML